MARAKLHIICGNCGASSEDLSFKICPEGHDVSEEEVKFESAVFINCSNCSTMHDLSDVIKENK